MPPVVKAKVGGIPSSRVRCLSFCSSCYSDISFSLSYLFSSLLPSPPLLSLACPIERCAIWLFSHFISSGVRCHTVLLVPCMASFGCSQCARHTVSFLFCPFPSLFFTLNNADKWVSLIKFCSFSPYPFCF